MASILYTYSYGLKLNFDGALESTLAFLTEIYMHPLVRILAYIAGGIAGWYFVEQKHLPFIVGKKTQQYISYLVALVFFGCIFKPPFQTLSPFTSTSILLLERIIFALTSSILIVSNAHGGMRWFFRFFETAFFQKFNRVVYAMFLLNPLITFGLPGFSQSNLYANPLSMVSVGFFKKFSIIFNANCIFRCLKLLVFWLFSCYFQQCSLYSSIRPTKIYPDC